MRGRFVLLFIALIGATLSQAQEAPGFGHSHLGTAFDSGLRSKPWKFKGLGDAPFPISTKNADLQSWYNQGNALLHSFWFEEAERSFRWCLKAEPENPMIYFALARCGLNWFSIGYSSQPELSRFHEFLKKAEARKDKATERERLYIEAWTAAYAKSGDEARKEMISRLQALTLRFPDDLEAKVQLAFYNIGQGSAFDNELLIQQILTLSPMHPGAHHARIHNWDDVDGVQAIASCELYGKAAPGVGHALHMPGHIYTGLGMWHEAAIAMDSATRVELRHMTERFAFPFENWNFPHNRDYLCYIQEQLGRFQASIQGSRDIFISPKDPATTLSQYPAMIPFSRALLKFEKWELILDEKTWPANLSADDQAFKSVSQVIALAELGRVEEAKEALKKSSAANEAAISEAIARMPDQSAQIRKDFEENEPTVFRVSRAKVMMAEGRRAEALSLLLEIAEKERVAREEKRHANDPPYDPWPAMRLVGDAYLAGGEFSLAISAYERTLTQVKNDAWALAGLAKAHAAKGERETAARYCERFFAVWKGADPNLKLVNEVRALNLSTTPRAETVKPERDYIPSSLDRLGPSNWRPFNAPALTGLDVNGQRISLAQFKGKNVLLVFYLSDQCLHCMDQLRAINKRIKEFGDLNTVVLAVSAATPAANKASLKLAEFSATLISDVNHANARRFASFDDFEDMELHSTILIDAQGKVRWKRTGGEPFDDVDYLLKEINRWEN
jgi:peroxiredoxin